MLHTPRTAAELADLLAVAAGSHQQAAPGDRCVLSLRQPGHARRRSAINLMSIASLGVTQRCQNWGSKWPLS